MSDSIFSFRRERTSAAVGHTTTLQTGGKIQYFPIGGPKRTMEIIHSKTIDGDKNMISSSMEMQAGPHDPLTSPLSGTLNNVHPKKLPMSSDSRLLYPRRVSISRRSVPSASPLAQYDNGFYSFFGSNSGTRIYRTPLSTRLPPARSVNFPDVKRPRRASCLPATTAWESGSIEHQTASRCEDEGNFTSATTTSGRKSALKTENNVSARSVKSNLRVSFDEFSPHKEIATPEHGSNHTPPDRNTRPVSRFNGRIELTPVQPRQVYRRYTIATLPIAIPRHQMDINTDVAGKSRGIGNLRRYDRYTEDSSNTTSSSRPSNTESAIQRNRTKHGNARPTSRRNFPVVDYNTITKPQQEENCETVMVLTADQLLVRKSIEKVQRWIEKLPRHFTTTHHILPPVQQDN